MTEPSPKLLKDFNDLECFTAVSTIPVPISYEIIRLFSEGLYQSPQKAIEELVSNSYDAHANVARVLMPPTSPTASDRLWVIDDGDGLQADGFKALWRIAESAKSNQTVEPSGRRPIGQFGIGKLAAYVLAWRLTHVSRDGDVVRVTSMNFRDIHGISQNNPDTDPYTLRLFELTLGQSQLLMADVQARDPAAWELLFGGGATRWTAAGLSDFKDLYSKLHIGRLKWVLRTAMPLVSNFTVFVDGQELESSKTAGKVLHSFPVGATSDSVADALGLTKGTDGVSTWIEIPGINGQIRGSATLFKERLTEGKSDRWDRSNGFFVRVRGRIINIDDELFGLPALNHSTWARFEMTIDADGLREHLLSSREGVRESDPIDVLRRYLHEVFNVCRKAYDDDSDKVNIQNDVSTLLRKAPSAFVVEPLVEAVRRTVQADTESYYVARVPDVEEPERDEWIATFADTAAKEPVSGIEFQATGRNDRAVRYRADSRKIVVNEDHPFIAKLISLERRTRNSASLFASAELLVDVLLQDYGLQSGLVAEILSDRDRVLRLVAGQEPTTAAEVLRLLKSAATHETALERAVGLAFRALGLQYERRGGNKGGADGVLDGRLGRTTELAEGFRLVYDAKQTKDPSVPADKINPGGLWTFKMDEKADYAFFLAVAYDAEANPEGKINKMIQAADAVHQPVTLLKVAHLQKLVELHYRYGLTLTRLRSLFSEAHTVPEVDAWLQALEEELKTLEPRVPLARLLGAIESARTDKLATPTVSAVRVLDDVLKTFTPERLTAALRAVEEIVDRRFVEVDEVSGEVRLHTTASQIVTEVDRSLSDLFGGLDTGQWPPEKE